MPRRFLYLLVAALAATALLAAGCGDDDDDGGDEAAESAATTETGGTGPTAGESLGKTVDVKLTEYMLDPPNPTVDAAEVTFNVTNEGKQEHSLEVEGPKGEVELEQPLKPGESGSLKVQFTPGRYLWYCPVDGHKDLGQQGTITVE